MSWYLKVMQKYAVFNGRARRKEYWMFRLFDIIFSIAALILDVFMHTAGEGSGGGLIYCLYSLATILPFLALIVRRMHDIGKSGWWLLVCLIPIIGKIWFFLLTIKDSQPGENEYGPNPKDIVLPVRVVQTV